MPFEDAKFDGPATRGDVAYLGIVVALALAQMKQMLGKLQQGEKITEEQIKALDQQIEKLDKFFQNMTGYHE